MDLELKLENYSKSLILLICASNLLDFLNHLNTPRKRINNITSKYPKNMNISYF